MGTGQHRREGRIERALREHLAAHPDEAFSTDDLCMVCYPGARRVGFIGDPMLLTRKHRVAVLRAINKVLPGLTDWRCDHTRNKRGNMLVFYNAASIPSTARAAVQQDGWHDRWRQDPPWDTLEGLAKAEQVVGEYLIMRDGSDEQRQRLNERKAAERELWAAKFKVAIAIKRNPAGVLLNATRIASGNIKELAEAARRLIMENDPDAIRDGLREIAAALDGIARETHDPMTTIRERLEAD